MENFEKHQKAYNKRIQRILGYFTQIDDEWIHQRLWFNDLKEFHIGQSNFWKDVLLADESTVGDKSRLYFSVVIYAGFRIERIFGKKREQIECGFEIEPQDDEIQYDKNEHEILLGWLWWNALYKEADKAEQLNPEQKEQLRKKQKRMEKIINKIGSLFYVTSTKLQVNLKFF